MRTLGLFCVVTTLLACRDPVGTCECGVDAAADAGSVCPPADVSTFVPPAYRPAHRQAGACSSRQIADFYDLCLDENTSSSGWCASEFGATGTTANRACAACILTPDTAATLGPVLGRGDHVDLNVAGCFELSGSSSCAQQIEANRACGVAACMSNCPVTDEPSFAAYEACLAQASQTGCSSFATQAAACTGGAADGGAASACVGGPNDGFREGYFSIVPLFCGGAAPEGGL
jgi:hypothetical protein